MRSDMPFLSQILARATAPILAFLILGGMPNARAGDETDARQLIQSVVSDAVQAYGGKRPGADERDAKLARMIERYGDMATYSADVLGRYGTRATPSVRSAFDNVLKRYLLRCWESTLTDVPLKLRVDITTTEILPDGRMMIHSMATVPNDTLAIDWTMTKAADGHLIVADASVDGISVFQTMKSDFLAILRSNGGQIDALSAALEKKLATLRDAR